MGRILRRLGKIVCLRSRCVSRYITSLINCAVVSAGPTHPHRSYAAGRPSFGDARPKVADTVQKIVLIAWAAGAATATGGRRILLAAQRQEAQ